MLALKKMFRVTIFVPPANLETLIESVNSSDPLRYGNYDSVMWWSSEGTEQFRPLETASPSMGSKENKERLPSVMVQFSLPHDQDILERVIKEAIIPVHPWEEPVITVHEVISTRTSAVEP